MKAPRLVIGNGHLGIWGALANVYPEASEQQRWHHRIVNVLDRLPQKKQAQALVWLREMMYAPTREKADEQKGKFQSVRLRTTAAKRYKRVENATAMIWQLLLVAEQGFRKVNAPELMARVAAGAIYENGLRSWP